MTLQRRAFLKLAAATGAVAAFGGLGVSLAPTRASAQLLRTRWASETTSVCCYCAVGCGVIVSTDTTSRKCINIEGDPDHPVNEGTNCCKGISLWQLADNPNRPKTPLYRAPYSDRWQPVSWDFALTEIARRVKASRDATFAATNAKGQTVNRTEGIAHIGSAALDNEECWALQALMRSLGLHWIEHQARICHSSTVDALAESYGRGAMTNHWCDIANSDVVLVMGSNAAENHPISFKWVLRAMDRGAKLIHIDPRFTRTSAKADLHVQIRTGTDIAILGGLIKYILDNDLIQKDYVLAHTNASFIVDKGYSFKNGLFSGYSPRKDPTQSYLGVYDKSKWAFETGPDGLPKKDPTLQNPRCVYQLLKKHYSRYDLNTVCSVAGADRNGIRQFYEMFASTGKPDKAGTIMYAMGWTQHTVGTQYIRTMAMVQLLLGNIGVAGGGVNALRGESNVQGSTDQGLLWHNLPGYLANPKADLPTLDAYIERAVAPHLAGAKDPMSAAWWQNLPSYMTSYLKAIYPAADPATAYQWLPRTDPGRTHTWLELFDAMHDGAFQGFFSWGQNPACGGANAGKNREAMAKLDWMVHVNLFDNETASFWHGPGMKPEAIKTKVFFLPAAASFEKEGSITNSGRWSQWRYKGPEPYGLAKSDGHIIVELYEKIREQYATQGGVFPEPILGLSVPQWRDGQGYNAHNVAKLINGYFLKDVEAGGTVYKKGTLVPSFAQLRADGSTSSGNWLFCASYTEKGNMAARRDPTQTEMQANIGLFPSWAWAWPLNRRILYNRASCTMQGQPYNPQKPVLRWNGDAWEGDVPDGGWAPGTRYSFIMLPNGHGHLFGPGRMDGPFPEHYEPMESPLRKHPFSGQFNNPTALHFADEEMAVADRRFPLVATTYRLTEHWQTGNMTRNVPWLLECQPQQFVEISRELAAELDIENGEKVWVESLRGAIWAKAMVSDRMTPMTVMGKKTHQIGLPWCFGWRMPADGSGGDSANLLTPSVGDANTAIPETKCFMANIRKAQEG